jgi:pimeloyl-ACP methyl ester carboxylesterase
VAPDLPFGDPQTTYAVRIRPALDALSGRSRPFVVVGHSLAAAYAPLVATATPDASLVYVCPAAVGPFGSTAAPMRPVRPGFEFPPEGPDGNNAWDPDVAIEAMYGRLPADKARALAAKLTPGSSPVDAYPLDGHPDVPSALIYGRFDEMFEPDWSRWVAREVAMVEPHELPTGHFPMAEDPAALADLLISLDLQ